MDPMIPVMFLTGLAGMLAHIAELTKRTAARQPQLKAALEMLRDILLVIVPLEAE